MLARRRSLAALCAAIAVLGVVRAVRPGDGPTVPVSVAAHDLAAGSVVGPDDVVVRRVPRRWAPSGSVAAAVGRTLATPVARGEPVSDTRLVSPTLASGYPGDVVLPVRIADPDAAALLKVGDHVDLVATDPQRRTSSYVATDVTVVALPAPSALDSSVAAPLGGRLVVVAALPSDVVPLETAAATALLSVVFSR